MTAMNREKQNMKQEVRACKNAKPGEIITLGAYPQTADGCSLYVYDKTNKDNYIIRSGEEVGCSWWWLRTQGNKPSRAYFVGTSCSIRSYANVSLARDGVRPALKINLALI